MYFNTVFLMDIFPLFSQLISPLILKSMLLVHIEPSIVDPAVVWIPCWILSSTWDHPRFRHHQ